MKKNLVLILIALISLLAVIILDYTVSIGEKLMRIHPYAGYGYYLLLLAFLLYFIIIPVLRIFFAPSVPSLQVADLPREKEALYRYGILLARNNKHVDKSMRKSHREKLVRELQTCKEEHPALNKVVEIEIRERLKLIDAEISRQALSVFLITALSQNGKFDFITNMVINLRLIHRVIRLSGFRPTYPQLTRLYTEVILASFITDLSENFLDEIDFSQLLKSVHLPVILLKSFIDGSMSALMTLRIGYITKQYIQQGTLKARFLKQNKAFRKEARRKAIKSAVSAYPLLAKEAAVKMRRSSVNALCGYVRGQVFSRRRKEEEGPFGEEQA